METTLNLPAGVTATKSQGRRAGFAAITAGLPSIQACIDKLIADGHLPGRKVEVWKTKNGWQPVVYRGGQTVRVQRHGATDLAVRGTGPKWSGHTTVAIED